MKELKINKKFNTIEEMEKFEEELSQNYVIFMITHKDKLQIENVLYFAER